MKKVSNKQRLINSTLSKIKKTLPNRCAICGGYGNDLAHILPRSLYPEYQINPDNLMILCRSCHVLFDNDKSFRKEQKEIINRAKAIDVNATNRYFDL